MLEDFFRLLVVALLWIHGVSHIIWFLASWTSVPTGVGEGTWILPGEITIRGRIGKMLGLLALMVVVVFTTAGLMLLTGMETWNGVANIGVFLSYAVVVPWLRQGPGSWALTSVIANIVLMFLVTPEISEVDPPLAARLAACCHLNGYTSTRPAARPRAVSFRRMVAIAQ